MISIKSIKEIYNSCCQTEDENSYIYIICRIDSDKVNFQWKKHQERKNLAVFFNDVT